MGSTERTPLLQTVIISPPRQRYPHSTIRYFCTIALTTALLTIIIRFLIPDRWLPTHHNSRARFTKGFPWPSPILQGEKVSYKELQEILLTTPKEEKAREWSQYYTSGPHLAGRNLSQAVWTRERWQEFGVQDSSLVTYDVFLNYPLGHRLALLENKVNGTEAYIVRDHNETAANKNYVVKYECSLEEDILDEDETSGLEGRVPTFHGYSANGNVTAQFVYANFGTWWDYDDLVKANVSLKGRIAIVKYGRVYRALKVQRAEELGMVGVVIYSDPQEDGEITEANGYKPYPDGPARNPSSVQRGSVELLNIVSGDPTTPGYPSKPGAPRQSPGHFAPSIPSLPISYRDALPLLKALNGLGPRAADFNRYWQGGGLGYKSVEYNIGPSTEDVVLNIFNEQDYTITPIWNVIGIINGTLPDEVVILGNHRDAWIAGGAGDPNSGSAALNEVVRSFGVALQKGWKPLRTIVFASWDGEEYGLLGSTEWVEEHIPWLSKAAVVYLNVDVGTDGPYFEARTTPLLHKVIHDATSIVPSPNQTIPGQTVRDLWHGTMATLGSGSDYAAFQFVAGVPSVDLGFRGNLRTPVYHYHSNYDSFAWMDKSGDPGWHYHITTTKVWAILAAALIESPVIAFNTTDYAISLSSYLSKIQEKAAASPDPFIRALSFVSLTKSIASLVIATSTFDAHAAALAASIDESIPWWNWWRKVKLYYELRRVNDRYKHFEKKFIFSKGLDGRPFYKHVVFAPGYWVVYTGVTFPGITESIETVDIGGIERWSEIIIEKIDDAAESLKV